MELSSYASNDDRNAVDLRQKIVGCGMLVDGCQEHRDILHEIGVNIDGFRLKQKLFALLHHHVINDD